jgi:PRC-barrel domain
MEIERIEDWIGRDVLDADGNKLGKLKEVYFRGDDAEIGEVKPGVLTRKRLFVPLAGAAATRDSLRVERSMEDHDVSAFESSSDRSRRLADVQEAEHRAAEAQAAAARAAVDAEDAAARAREAEEAAAKADDERRIAAARVERVKQRDPAS